MRSTSAVGLSAPACSASATTSGGIGPRDASAPSSARAAASSAAICIPASRVQMARCSLH